MEWCATMMIEVAALRPFIGLRWEHGAVPLRKH
jgi:hypothetical protein